MSDGQKPEQFFARVEARARRLDTLLCVGLDPHPADLDVEDYAALGDHGRDVAAYEALEFCRNIIEQTRDVAAAYKPNSAFFEALGASGFKALQTLIRELHDIPTILDAKRGDIGSTSAAYATAAFSIQGAGSITVQPYLGWEAIAPFLTDRSKSVFVLCRTTNEGAQQYQETRDARGIRLFERIAADAAAHEHAGQIGLVAAGTDPAALARIRGLAPDAWLLVPGIGAQGADADAAVAAGLRADGLGILVSSSRSIARAESPREAATKIRDQIRLSQALARKNQASASKDSADAGAERLDRTRVGASAAADFAEIAAALLATGCVQFGSFVLKSGLSSPVYLDLRRLSGSADAMFSVGRAYVDVLQRVSFDRVAALPYAGLPLATAACIVGGYPMIYPRKEPKDHGRRLAIEGPFEYGETAVVVDDLATRGTSVLEALPSLTAAGLHVHDVVVLVDRQSGATARLAERGLRLHAVATMRQLLSHWRDNGAVSTTQVDDVLRFLDESAAE